MNKHTVLETMALAAEAYNPGRPNEQGSPVSFHSAPNGVQFFVRRRGRGLCIVFRGSDSPLDWGHNLAFDKLEVPGFCPDEGVRAHRGFLAAYTSPNVRGLIHTMVHQAEAIRISGHSYGAALATLCALDLRLSYPDKDAEVFLFGSPRVGNKAFMRCYNKHVLKTIRVECGNDVVTKIPFAIMGYRHVGSRFHVGARRLPLVLRAEDHYPSRYYQGLLKRLLP